MRCSVRASAPVVGVAVLVVAALAALGACSASEPHTSRAETVALNQRLIWSRYGSPLAATAPVGESQMLIDMIAHHQDAIDASLVVLQRASAPEVHDFAERLVRVQSQQVEQLSAWLAEWYPDATTQATWVRLFDEPRTVATDTDYVTTMIEHHRHAVAMYENWVASGALHHDEFGLLMRRVAKGQIGEVAALRQVLG